jgi:hypothetical protein
VRIPNPRLVRLGGVSGGAIVEPGDGELIVSPLLQPVLELSSPLDTLYINSVLPTGQQQDSFFVQFRTTAGGVVGAVSQVMATFSRGAWILECTTTFQWVNAATIDRRFGLFMGDPAGAGFAALLSANMMQPGGNLFMRRELRVVIQRDGFFLTLQAGATAGAGDAYTLEATCNARRII